MQKGNDATDYDIVIGGAANDKVFNTVEFRADSYDGDDLVYNKTFDTLDVYN